MKNHPSTTHLARLFAIAGLLVVHVASPATAIEKPRVIATTDGEVDDRSTHDPLPTVCLRL